MANPGKGKSDEQEGSIDRIVVNVSLSSILETQQRLTAVRRHQRQDDNAVDSSHDDPDDDHRQDEHLLRAQPIDDVDGFNKSEGG